MKNGFLLEDKKNMMSCGCITATFDNVQQKSLSAQELHERSRKSCYRMRIIQRETWNQKSTKHLAGSRLTHMLLFLKSATTAVYIERGLRVRFFFFYLLSAENGVSIFRRERTIPLLATSTYSCRASLPALQAAAATFIEYIYASIANFRQRTHPGGVIGGGTA